MTTANPSAPRGATRTSGRLDWIKPVTHSWAGRIGLLIVCFILLVIALGPLFAPNPPNELSVGLPLSGPTAGLPFGTDSLGRDVFSRFLNGGRVVLLVPLAAVGLAALFGGLPGMIAAYVGGPVDAVISRIFDILLTLPPLLIALAVVAGFGSSTIVLIVTVAAIYAPQVGRVARGATSSVIAADYIQAARARGERPITIVVREIAPNIASPVISDLALRVTYGVIFVATLSFLGLGAQPPAPDWGLSIATSLGFIQVQPWAALLPIIGIAALSVGLNLVADSIVKHVNNDALKDSML